MSVVCAFKSFNDDDGEYLFTQRMGAVPRVGDVIMVFGKDFEDPRSEHHPVAFTVHSVQWEVEIDEASMDLDVESCPTIWLVPDCATFLKNSTKKEREER